MSLYDINKQDVIKTKQRALVEQEFESLLGACRKTKERYLVTVLTYQGLRINELRRMEPEYYFTIDSGDMLHIPAKAIEPGREYVKSDDRVIPIMHTDVTTIWKKWFEDHDTYDVPYVTCQKMIERLGKRAGIGHITCHTLRHTCGTWLAYKDYNAVEIAEFMGHKSISTAMKHYIHPTGGMMRAGMKSKGGFE